MQPLNKMSPKEKGELLFELFPLEIPAFVIFLQYIADNLITNNETVRLSWDEAKETFTFTFWLSLAEEVSTLVQKRQTDLAQSKSYFSIKLFDGYAGFFSTHCLRLFIKSDKCTDYHFRLAAQLLFDFS